MLRKHRIKTSGRFTESHVGTPKVGINPPTPSPQTPSPTPLPPHPQPCKPLAQVLLTPGEPAGHLMEVVSFLRPEGPWPESSTEQQSLRAHVEEAREVPRHTA